MTDFLVFTVFAPLASWGDPAIGEVRDSWDRPSRSAVLGLVAAALGVTRDDQESHRELDEGFGVAVRVVAPGASLVDYHTTQTVTLSRRRRLVPATRKALLESGDRDTILSQRTLRQDALSMVALWRRSTPRWSLQDLANALREPVFVLYAGRKANALGLPLNPRVQRASSLAAVLGTLPVLPEETRHEFAGRLKPRAGWGREVAHDPCEGFASGLEPAHVRTVLRRDTSPHRVRWQFAERVVEIGLLPSSAEPGHDP